MATTLYRIIKYGFQGFWRNGWVSVAATAIMIIVLSVFVGLIIFSAVGEKALDILKEKIDISVYFKTNTSEDEILKIKRSLESLAEVKVVEYISKEQALVLFKERHKGDSTIVEAVDVLEGNPLSASLNIKAKDLNEYPVIAAYLNNQNLQNAVEQVTYNQNQLVIQRLTSIVNNVQRAGFLLIIILSLIAVLVNLNTIVLSIHSTREEIGIMKLVGASNSFVRGPYIVQGVIYAFIATVVTTILMIPALTFISSYINVLIPEMNVLDYFYGSFWSLIGYQILLGSVLGAISSLIAVRRYLKV